MISGSFFFENGPEINNQLHAPRAVDIRDCQTAQWAASQNIPLARDLVSVLFFFLSCLMAVFLVIPYAVLAGVSKVFGIWEAWENISPFWATLIPFCVGSVFAYGGWRLLDDY